VKVFTLEVITQEKHLDTQEVVSITVMTEMGQITVLADHIPLFARLQPGELEYKTASGRIGTFVVTGGFIDVSPRNIVTILADSAIRSEDINLEKAEQAIARAKKALDEGQDNQNTLKIELELRHAILQANVARRQKNRQNS
jgi:F-type H+-transporting ATPase subunit epsilon